MSRTKALFSGSLLLFVSYQACAAEPRDPITNFFLYTSTNSVDYQINETPAPHSNDPNIMENQLRGNFIVSKTDTNTWSVHQSVDEFQMNNSPVITQTNVALPQSLWDIETGGAFQHHIGDRRDWGISTSIGSASNKPYDSIHEDIFRATGTYHIPSGAENSWLFFLAYSNNRHFANNVPLPGFAYLIHSPEYGLDAALGLPFLAVNYKPTERLSGRFSVFGPDNMAAEWAYLFWKPVQAYAGWSWGQEEWLPADRADNSDRLFYDQKKWSLGLRFPVCPAVRLDLSGNYVFDRRFYENDRAVNSNIPDVELDPGWALIARLSTRW